MDKKESLILEEARRYLTEKHRTLKNDYKTPSGRHPESCNLIAVEIARKFLRNGLKPRILLLQGQKPADGSDLEYLRPIVYKGWVNWRCHVVCCYKNIVYDPMAGIPLPLKKYLEKMFDQPVKISVEVPEEKIENYINPPYKYKPF